jgi:hypothetical protein
MRRRRCWSTTVTFLALLVPALAPAATSAAPAVVPKPLCCIPTGPVDALAISGNTAYVGGDFHHMGLAAHHLAVLGASDGQLDSGWPGTEGGYLTTAIGDGSGGWFVAGGFTSIGGIDRPHLAHLLPDKSVDTSWAATTNGQVNTLVRDGSVLYAGGAFSQANGSGRSNLAAFNASTGELTTFQADTDDTVNALAVSSRCGDLECSFNVRRLFVGGSFTHIGGAARDYLAAIDLVNGDVVGSNANLNAQVNALAVRPGLSRFSPVTVYAGGAFTVVDEGNSNVGHGHGARFDENATTEQNWDPHANDSINTIAVGPSAIYLAGFFSQLGNGNPRTQIGAVDRNTGTATTWAPTLTTSGFGGLFVKSMVLLGPNVYVGGRFDHANTIERRGLAAFDASSGAVVSSWDPDPATWLGVEFLGSNGTTLITSGEFETIAGIERHNLAAVDLSSGQVLPFNPDVDDQVSALALQGSTLYAVGKFTRVGAGALSRNHAAAFNTATGQPTAFDPNANAELYSVAPAGGTVFLGGAFTKLGGGTADRKGVAEVDAGSGAVTTFRQDLDGWALGLGLRDDTLFIGGQFHHIGATAREAFASVRLVPGTLGAVTTLDLGLDFNNNGLASVRSMLLHGSTLYLSGEFDEMLGASRLVFGAFDVTTGQLRPFELHSTVSFATTLAADELNLFMGGQFGTLGGAARPVLGSVDLQSGAVNDWLPALPVDTGIQTIATSPEAGVLLGGYAIGPAHRTQGILLAYALQPSTPAAPQATPGDGEASVSFSAPADGGSPITQYKVTASPGGQTATGAGSPITVGGLTNGTSYTFTISAANAAGESPQSPPSSAVTPTATAPAAGGSPSPVTALTVSGFKVTNKRFKVAKARTPLVARRTPKGTTFVFRLSAAAVSRIAIAQALPGRKRGARCVAPRKGLKKRCTRYVKKGTLVRNRTKAGSNRVPFTGRMGKRALRPGTYRATLTATDATGRRSKPVSLTFRVVKR